MGLVEVLSSRVLLHPTDFDRSLRFYRDQLGLRVYREYGTGGRLTGVVLFLGGGFLELVTTPAAEGGAGRPVDLWLQVPDVGVEAGRLRGLGLVAEDPELRPWGLIELWLEDPDGHRIVLVEVPEGHPIRTRLATT